MAGKSTDEIEADVPDLEFDIVEPEAEDAVAVEPEAEEEAEAEAPEADEPAPVAAPVRDPEVLAALRDINDRLAGVEPQVAELGKARLEIAESGVSDAIANVRAARKKAMEDGDTEAFDRLDDQLGRLRVQSAQIDQMKRAAAAAPARKTVTVPQTQTAPDWPAPARNWMAKNRWFNPTGDDEQSVMARSISDMLLSKFNGSDPRHYEEVDKRMAKQFPKLYGAGAARQKPAAAAGARRPAQEAAGDPQRVAITRGVYNNFKLAGFDVDDPKVKAKMVKAVNETAAQHGFKRAG